MIKKLVITGGNRGIGLASIKRFIGAGWQVVNISRSPCHIDGVANLGIDLNAIDTISSYADKLKALLADATEIAVVHNAAFYECDTVESFAVADMQKTLNVNVVAPAALNQILIPLLPAGSCIVFLGSTLSRKAVPGSASYAVAKHAVMGLMKATCQDLRDRKIRSCSVCPGLVDTKLLNDTMDAATQKYLLENVIIGKRLIQPEEIADVIYFVATTHCLNGVNINADLGQVAD